MRLNQRPNRTGHTLIELVVSMASATVLMVGLASTLYISSQAFNDEGSAAFQKTAAAGAQSKLMADIRSALTFSERTPTAVTFTVPDRDGDNSAETIRYAWSGTPGDPLTLVYNGSAPSTFVEDVRKFDLTYLTRFMTAEASGVFGYDTVFATPQYFVRRIQIGTFATLPVDATVTDITARISSIGNKDVKFAIYTDNGGEPGTLIVESATVKHSGASWLTIPVSPTVLSAGDYWLALSFDSFLQAYRRESGGETRFRTNRATKNGYLASWGTSNASYTHKVSIYADYTPN